MHKLRPWLVESHAVSALWADATSHLLSPLAHPGSVVLPKVCQRSLYNHIGVAASDWHLQGPQRGRKWGTHSWGE